MDDTDQRARVRALPLAAALGIVWGLAMLGCGIAAIYTSYADKMVEVFGSVYYGYGPTWGGAFLGLAWGFADAFVGTLVIMGLYCLLARCCSGSRAAAPAGRPM